MNNDQYELCRKCIYNFNGNCVHEREPTFIGCWEFEEVKKTSFPIPIWGEDNE